MSAAPRIKSKETNSGSAADDLQRVDPHLIFGGKVISIPDLLMVF
jgi:hypothetical protein